MQTLLDRAYAAFNARDIDAVLALMHPDVAWPNGMEGGYVYGHDAVRAYWTRQWAQIDPNVEPLHSAPDANGRVVLRVHQRVRDLSGAVLVDQEIQHVYEIDNELIVRMEIRPGDSAHTTSRVLPINGIDLAFDDLGAGPRAVLLVHGHPFNRTMWSPQAELLRSRFRVIVPDLRGYGESTMPEDARETFLETFAADHFALMDALGIRTFMLGGLSMGGQIVMEMMRQAPERIEALLLADTFAGLDSPERKQLRFTTADRLEREGMDTYAREELTKMITPRNAEELPDVAAHVTTMMRTTPPRGAAAALRGRAQRIDYLPLLGQIHVPTLIVVGREDVYTPVALAEELHANIESSRLVVIENAGHMPNLERPDEFNAALLESWGRPLAGRLAGGSPARASGARDGGPVARATNGRS